MNPLMEYINKFIQETPSSDNTSKPMRVRVFERKRPVGDFSISYKKDKTDKSILGHPFFCFEAYADVNGFVIKKTSQHSNGNSDLFVKELPIGGKLTTKANRRILELYFNCDIVYVATGERRYKD